MSIVINDKECQVYLDAAIKRVNACTSIKEVESISLTLSIVRCRRCGVAQRTTNYCRSCQAAIDQENANNAEADYQRRKKASLANVKKLEEAAFRIYPRGVDSRCVTHLRAVDNIPTIALHFDPLVIAQFRWVKNVFTIIRCIRAKGGTSCSGGAHRHSWMYGCGMWSAVEYRTFHTAFTTHKRNFPR